MKKTNYDKKKLKKRRISKNFKEEPNESIIEYIKEDIFHNHEKSKFKGNIETRINFDDLKEEDKFEIIKNEDINLKRTIIDSIKTQKLKKIKSKLLSKIFIFLFCIK
jgi:hypothetical protein